MYNASIYSRTTGTTVYLTGDETNKQVVSIQGLTPAPATINTSVAAGIDGARFNSSRLEPRNIVVLLKLNNAQTVRQALELALPTKGEVTFRYTAGTYAVEIDGYVDSWECDLFSMAELAQISIICPNPYFRSQTTIQKTLLAAEASDIGATSSIENGFQISALVINTSTSLEIINESLRGNPSIKVTYSFQTGDIISIDTRRGSKSVMLTRSGTKTNIFSAVDPASKFFQINSSSDLISYKVSNDTRNNTNMTVVFTYSDLYAGV